MKGHQFIKGHTHTHTGGGQFESSRCHRSAAVCAYFLKMLWSLFKLRAEDGAIQLWLMSVGNINIYFLSCFNSCVL